MNLPDNRDFFYTGKFQDRLKLHLYRSLVCLSIIVTLSGCGLGICVGDDNFGGCLSSSTSSPRLIISGLAGLTIRKNDCYPLTLSALNESGNPMTDVTASVTVSASSGVVLYSTLDGCQTYDSSFEHSTFALTPAAPSVVFYFRSDVDGGVSLSASTTSDVGLSPALQPIDVAFASFENTKGPSGIVDAITTDSSGRTLLGGRFTSYDDLNVSYVARLTVDGALDTSFAPTGSGLDGRVTSVAVQSDGKVIVGGLFTAYAGTARPYLARLNSDGSLDTSFAQTGTGLNNSVNAVAIQGDGKILAAGQFTFYNATSRRRLIRLEADGSLDPTFTQTGTGLNGTIYSIALQADGRLVVGGSFINYNGTSRPYIARLDSDGSLDASFTTGTGFNSSWVTSVGMQADGKVLVAGLFTSYNGTPRRYVARLNSDGSVDATFATTGTGLSTSPNAISVQTDGKVIVAGGFTSYDSISRPYVVRLNADGSLDTGFAPVGTGLNTIVNCALPLSDGRVFLGGLFASYNGVSRPYVIRLNSDGSMDSSFGASSTGPNGVVFSIEPLSNGNILLGGSFTQFNGTTALKVARLQSDGSLDSSFYLPVAGFSGGSDFVSALATQADDKILVGGGFNLFDGSSTNLIARLNSNGTLDSSFAPTGSGLGSFGDSVVAIAIQPDGRILFGGQFLTYNGSTARNVVRLHSDGSLDTSFSPTGTGVDGKVNTLVLLSDGKILAGGQFTSYNGASAPRVLRLNADGTLDGTFIQTGTGFGSGFMEEVNSLRVQADGKVIAGGNFTAYNGTSRPYLLRLNSDGSLDTTFAQVGTGLNNVVKSLALQPNGRVLAGGYFSTYNGVSSPRLVRLNSDGSLDTSLTPLGTGFNGLQIACVSFLPSAKILVGGDFSSYGPQTVGYLARLTYLGSLD